MKMSRIALLAAASAAVLLPAATAQAQSQTYRSVQECEAARQNRQVAGAVIGAILGGVIAAQIEDDVDDRDNRNWRGRGHGRNNYYNRGRGRGRGYDRGNENDVAVAAGAGIGGLLGYGVASGQPCGAIYSNDRNANYGGYDNGGYYDNRAYNDNSYNNTGYYDDQGRYYEDDRYTTSSDAYAGDQRYYGSDSTTLAGAPDGYVYSQPSADARVYSATSNTACRWMETRRADGYGAVTTHSVYMCQGSDGIWRPAN